MENEPGEGKKLKKAEKKGIDNTTKKTTLLRSEEMICYCRSLNKYIFTHFGYIIRVEMKRRGITYEGLIYLLNKEGIKINRGTLNSTLHGSSSSWHYTIIYYCFYVLGIKFKFEDILSAKELIKEMGYTVK